MLELPDGTILLDTRILMEYMEDAYPDQGYTLLPSDPVTRCKMRMAYPMAEKLFTAYYVAFMSKGYVEAENNAIRENLQIVEDYLKAHGNDKSPYAFGTENPTQLDFHLYGALSRLEFFRNSVHHDSIFVPIGFDEFTRCVKLYQAISERPELKNVLCTKRAHQEYLEVMNTTPPGNKIMLYLPVVYE